jgi:hypothetical protein
MSNLEKFEYWKSADEKEKIKSLSVEKTASLDNDLNSELSFHRLINKNKYSYEDLDNIFSGFQDFQKKYSELEKDISSNRNKGLYFLDKIYSYAYSSQKSGESIENIKKIFSIDLPNIVNNLQRLNERHSYYVNILQVFLNKSINIAEHMSKNEAFQNMVDKVQSTLKYLENQSQNLKNLQEMLKGLQPQP